MKSVSSEKASQSGTWLLPDGVVLDGVVLDGVVLDGVVLDGVVLDGGSRQSLVFSVRRQDPP